ncbi:MAG: transcription termination/antitermination protein NusA [Verrucomicrobia bacterium]|jgi:transcription termination/antitermination protein NusA|nr:transcription termination/antitermination protein NusA [Verrucomicrobiota bacterium]
MNNELIAILNYMEKERGIDREILIEAVEFALQSAARKNAAEDEDMRVVIDRTSCDIKAYATRIVTDSPKAGPDEVTLKKALKTDPNAKVGDALEVECSTANLGRIAAQTAKQAITQRIRQAEREIVFDEYKDRVGDIVSGGVRQFNRSDIVVDLGRAEGVLPSRERVPTEEYQVGDRIRAYIVSVQNNQVGPAVILSRSHPDFVRRLFELEVSEISDGIVEIKGIAREPGYRTKIAVVSSDPKVDPVGACVGMRGMRVKNIVRELSGEKIDIIRWSEDTKTYVTNALSPARLAKVDIVEKDEERVIHVIADPDQLSLAIGKRGQNVRLSAKLVGWKIDIHKDESAISFEEKVSLAIERLAEIDGISQETAQALVGAGFLTVEGVLAAEAQDLAEMLDIDIDAAKEVYAAVEAGQQDTEA